MKLQCGCAVEIVLSYVSHYTTYYVMMSHEQNNSLICTDSVLLWHVLVKGFTPYNSFAAGRPLFYVSLHLFQQHGFIQQFHLDIVKLMNLFSKSIMLYVFV